MSEAKYCFPTSEIYHRISFVLSASIANKKEDNKNNGRIIIASVLAVVISIFFVFLIVTGYAFYLAFEARGAPDNELINRFAGKIGANYTLAIEVVFTFLAALWIKRKSLPAKIPAGFIIATGVIIPGVFQTLVFHNFFNTIDLLWYGLILIAGWIGGIPWKPTNKPAE